MTTTKKRKNPFKEGPIAPQFIADQIEKHQHKTEIGAHELFLGQVRADKINNSEVVGIEYSCYEDMALEAMHVIREEVFAKYELSCMHIYHSLGYVKTGQICLFVFVSSPRRKAVYEALRYTVEAIKERVPIFGKEILANDQYVWKENTK